MAVNKKQILLIGLLVALSLSLLGACKQVIRVFHKEVQASPAPTALPLATVSPTEVAASPTPGDSSLSPTFSPQVVATEPTLLPTRVVSPQEAIQLPPGFGISVYAEGLKGPRLMTVGPDQHLYVAERGAGRIIRLPDRDRDGVADGLEVVAEGLDAPSSLVFYQDGSLYVGETTQILRLTDPDGAGVFQDREIIIEGLPAGGHSTRTVLFSPDWEYLFVSVGSSCNVCVEEDQRRATIMRYLPDGSQGQVYAKGLRNAVGIVFRPGTDELWATNNGRDWLGDDQPPETIYVVKEGDDAGWPSCHAGRLIDPDFGQANACQGILDPVVEMQAHSAPLGLTFYTGEQFPLSWRGLFVAFHGSWNRSEPTGYKVVHVPLDADGQPGPTQDFASGWLREDGSQWGRPVGVQTSSDGGLFISDDGAGFIYRIFYRGD